MDYRSVGAESYNLLSEFILEVCSMLEYEFPIFNTYFSLKQVMVYTGCLAVVLRIIDTVFDYDPQ